MIAVFAGSFDPITIGHMDVIRRAAIMFERLYVCVSANPSKNARFSADQRIELVREAVSSIPNVVVEADDGILVEYCRRVGAGCIIRGIRSGDDVQYEVMLESVNKRIAPEIETMYLLAEPEHSYISSSLVRQLLDIDISIQGLVPNADHILFKKG